MTEISKHIRQLRIKRGLSQAQLAERLNVTRQTVSSWERDMSHPDINTLEKMASVFEISLEELLFARPSVKAKQRLRSVPLSGRFVLWSAVSYFVLLIWGGAYIAVPLFRALVGGGIQEEFVFVIYWGLFLLVVYIAICTCLISEYCAERCCESCDPCGGAPDQRQRRIERRGRPPRPSPSNIVSILAVSLKGLSL